MTLLLCPIKSTGDCRYSNRISAVKPRTDCVCRFNSVNNLFNSVNNLLVALLLMEHLEIVVTKFFSMFVAYVSIELLDHAYVCSLNSALAAYCEI